jgi:hypothetical protein
MLKGQFLGFWVFSGTVSALSLLSACSSEGTVQKFKIDLSRNLGSSDKLVAGY